MRYRVIFDFGDLEITVFEELKRDMPPTEERDDLLAEMAMETLLKRGTGLPPETHITCVEPCPEWDEGKTVTEWCSHCEAEVELPEMFMKHACPNCKIEIKPCNQCETMECEKCPLGADSIGN